MRVSAAIPLALSALLVSLRPAGAEPMLLAGEIVIGSEPAKTTEKKPSGARQQVNKARSWSKDAPDDVQTESDGVLAPRQEIPGSSAREQRLRARDFQRATDQSRSAPVASDESGETASTAERAREQRNRAAGYLRPKGIELTGQTGSDGIPFVNCPDQNNTVGVIGDEQPRSGNIIQILVKGKPLKVRCR